MELALRAREISPSPTLSIDAQAKQMKQQGIDIVGFGAGEPDFDTPQHIKDAAIAAINAGFTKYTPVSGTDELRQAVVNKFKHENNLDYQINQIVISTGAKQSLYNTVMVLCNPGDEVILAAPYWGTYIEQIKLAGAVPKIINTNEENGFKIIPDELEAACTSRTKMLLLNSPSNPTGAVYTKEELEALAEVILKHRIYVLSDEIYEKLIYDGLEHISIASLTPELKELTVIINGVSKSYAMTGWRIGYAAVPDVKVAKAMTDLQSHSTSNATTISQKAAVAALTGSQQPLQHMLEEFTRRRNYMLERFAAIDGITCNKPGGAFYVFPSIAKLLGRKYKDRVINNSTDFASILLEEAKVAIVPGIAFGNDSNIRLSYATSMENIKEGLDRIEEIVSQIK